MLALQITSTKHFMNQLLTGDCFSSFLLENATITTYNTFSIDGRVRPEFYDSDDAAFEEKTRYIFSPFSEIQEFLFSYIKGSRTPLHIKITLLLKPEAMDKLLNDENCTVQKELISAFALNIKYDGAKIILTTAISYTGFTMDKSAEPIWDNALKKFLSAKEIAFEEI